ncbi:transcriptional regulator [uncultured Methanobrevibacter sp.]|uniref:transcriptional regulator n=1 Tax=uncultured Methanobrevibacter sp. TaxID=253161 RepID=UPI0025F670DD|nr:transcriptional regulator [uncultured Methanobrevibacter sp.]
MDDETVEFVKRSQYRQRVLKSLEDDVLMPKQIAERSDIKVNHVSKVLSELKSKDLIEIINPEMRKGRLYRQTDNGKIVSKNISIE